MTIVPTLPSITLPIVAIEPSTTYQSDTFYYSAVGYTLPLEITRKRGLTANDRAVYTAELSLIKAREQIVQQINSLRDFAYLMAVPAREFIDDIRGCAIKLLLNDVHVRQAIIGGYSLAISTYLVSTENRFGYEVILHVQTFDGMVVFTERRSKNVASQIVFNGQLVYLNGLVLT